MEWCAAEESYFPGPVKEQKEPQTQIYGKASEMNHKISYLVLC